MKPQIVKTIGEEYLYLKKHPCKCGGQYKLQFQRLLNELGIKERGIVIPEGLTQDYFVEIMNTKCEKCNTIKEFYFILIKGDEFKKEREEQVKKHKEKYKNMPIYPPGKHIINGIEVEVL